MKITGKDIIDRIADLLPYENARCYDSEITEKLRSLSSAEIAHLFISDNTSERCNDEIKTKYDKQIKERDLLFLKEMQEKLENAIENKDATLFDYVLKMIQDWIDELESI